MKKIFSIALTLAISIFAVSAALADEGEAEEPSNVAPAIIQAPPTAPAVQQPCGTCPSASLPQAQPGVRSIREASLRTADSQSMEGAVVCVIPSGIMQPKSKVVLADASGSETEFKVKVLAVVYDSKGTILSVDQLCPGDRVLVNYRIAGCMKEATSIKVLK